MSISVIIPTHDRPSLLAEALNSVARQTLPPAEVLVVDDLDDERVRGVIDAMRKGAGHHVTHVRSTSSAGASASRNLGARRATGELVAFLDDDDLWDPRYLERAVAGMRATGADVVVTWLNLETDGVRRPGKAIREGLSAEAILGVNPGVTGSNLIVRRQALADVGGWDESLWVSNDKDLMIRLLDAGHRYAVVEERLVVKRAHSGPRLGSPAPRRVQGLEAFAVKYARRLSPHDRRVLAAKRARVQAHGRQSTIARAAAVFRFLIHGGPQVLGRPRTWAGRAPQKRSSQAGNDR